METALTIIITLISSGFICMFINRSESKPQSEKIITKPFLDEMKKLKLEYETALKSGNKADSIDKGRSYYYFADMVNDGDTILRSIAIELKIANDISTM